MSSKDAVLEIEGLEVRISTPEGEAVAIDGVDMAIHAGEMFGVIGETGAGKSLTGWAAIDLLPYGAQVTAGEVRWCGRRLTGMPESAMRAIRGREISIITQNPQAALNPMKSVGSQIAEVVRAHQDVSYRHAHDMAIEALRRVGIPDAPRRARAYPHQLSGGMAQRVLITLAMINGPRLLIADEPTTGLDVTIQAEILDLMVQFVQETGAAIWFITHDLGIIANYTERVAVMFAGQIVEIGPTDTLFESPQHPYTRGFLDAVVSDEEQAERLSIAGPPPSLVRRPSGCQFAGRCPLVEATCRSDMPRLLPAAGDREVRCFVAQRENEGMAPA